MPSDSMFVSRATVQQRFSVRGLLKRARPEGHPVIRHQWRAVLTDNSSPDEHLTGTRAFPMLRIPYCNRRCQRMPKWNSSGSQFAGRSRELAPKGTHRTSGQSFCHQLCSQLPLSWHFFLLPFAAIHQRVVRPTTSQWSLIPDRHVCPDELAH